MEATITEVDESTVEISVGNKFYELIKDTVTGDWVVTCGDDLTIQSDWMLTQGDAIKYALMKSGVLEDADYERAPDRTSA